MRISRRSVLRTAGGLAAEAVACGWAPRTLAQVALGGAGTPPIRMVNGARTAGLDFVLRNGAMGRKYQVETLPGGLGVIDFDGDGCADLVWYDSATGQVYLQFLHGLGQPTGAMVYTASSLSWKIVAVEDVDGDGRPVGLIDVTDVVGLFPQAVEGAGTAKAARPAGWGIVGEENE